jgi:hypothetical protein
MSQIGAGKVARTRLQTNIPNVPNRENNYFSTAKIFSNGYGILSGHGPGTEQTKKCPMPRTHRNVAKDKLTDY